MKKRNGKAVSTQLTEKEFISLLKLCERTGSSVSQLTRGLIRYGMSRVEINKINKDDEHWLVGVHVMGAESFK